MEFDENFLWIFVKLCETFSRISGISFFVKLCETFSGISGISFFVKLCETFLWIFFCGYFFTRSYGENAGKLPDPMVKMPWKVGRPYFENA